MAATSPSTRTSFLDLAGSKLRNRLSSNLNESVATGANDFAKRQLEKLGWKEGEGLGKRRDGISTHIRVTKRVDEQGGLGKSSVDENLQIGNEWWKDNVGNTLAKLGKNKKKKNKDGKKPKKMTYTDEELFEATGGSRFGTKGGKRKRMEVIGKEEEERAKESIEWDGMTAPQVILSEPPSKKKKKGKSESTDDRVVEENKEERKKRKEEKKKRKKSEKKSKKKKKEGGKRK